MERSTYDERNRGDGRQEVSLTVLLLLLVLLVGGVAGGESSSGRHKSMEEKEYQGLEKTKTVGSKMRY